jgi:hypothetical protein
VAKIIQETVDIENDKETRDFESGVFLVTADNYPQTTTQRHEAERRGKRRLGERQYSVFHNNFDWVFFFNILVFGRVLLSGKPTSILPTGALF